MCGNSFCHTLRAVASNPSSKSGAVTGLLVLVTLGCVSRGPNADEPFLILHDGQLASGFDLGVDSDPRRPGWVRFEDGRMTVEHAADAQWGAVTFLLGLDDPGRRLTEELSGFSSLEITVSGRWGVPTSLPSGWSGSGVGVTAIGAVERPASSAPHDMPGQECWLKPPGDDSPRTYRVPLPYLTAGAWPDQHRPLWSPAQIILPANATGAAYLAAFEEIRLLPASLDPDAHGDPLCPEACLCLTLGCHAACGRKDNR